LASKTDIGTAITGGMIGSAAKIGTTTAPHIVNTLMPGGTIGIATMAGAMNTGAMTMAGMRAGTGTMIAMMTTMATVTAATAITIGIEAFNPVPG